MNPTDTTITAATRLLDDLDKDHDPGSGDYPSNTKIITALADAGLLTTPLAPNRLSVVPDHFDTPDPGDDYALHLDYANEQDNLNITDYLWAALIAVAQHAAHHTNMPEPLAATTLIHDLLDRAHARYTPDNN